ncbi:MAG: winged helix-turn-helix transcriptional regulator [Anaerolineae bacterium]|nr:winged helix-turn-helix transcriptional regulator [Anaerolineae bacterium]
MSGPRLLWDCGTAYDLFVSLVALHRPAMLGIRPSWAAGVRARLPVDARETLEQAHKVIDVPFHWLYGLPGPKNAAAAIAALEQVPPAERLPRLTIAPDLPCDVTDLLADVKRRGGWQEKDRQALQQLAGKKLGHHDTPPADDLAATLDAWADPAGFGERFLNALRAYYDVFFAEEERHIAPALEAALANAQAMAAEMPRPTLLEELSRGLVFDEAEELQALVLAPSYWSTPLVYFGSLGPGREIWLFGARPPDASLDPGAPVPDTLLQALKALSDPTRLRILRYLAHEPLSPADLARRLRLRLPTVTHHLKALRLAGLVRLHIHEGKTTGLYALRHGAVVAAFDQLATFLTPDHDDA